MISQVRALVPECDAIAKRWFEAIFADILDPVEEISAAFSPGLESPSRRQNYALPSGCTCSIEHVPVAKHPNYLP